MNARKTPQRRTVARYLRLPRDVAERLDAGARERGETLAQYVTRLLRKRGRAPDARLIARSALPTALLLERLGDLYERARLRGERGAANDLDALRAELIDSLCALRIAYDAAEPLQPSRWHNE